jgi:orotate phosphoribosyltransferase
MYDRQQLIQLFQDRALKFGKFQLASGKESSYYLDGKQICLHSTGLRLVSHGLLDLLSDVPFAAIGGLTMGADPIVGGVLVAAAERGISLDGFLIRKEPKGHGTMRYVEGPVQKGTDVIIIDDVVTTGGSALQAVERIVEYGCNVVCVVGIVDRMEGGAQTFAQHKLPFRALLTIEDFGITPPVPAK